MAQPLERFAEGLGGMVDELAAVEAQLRVLLAGLPDVDPDPDDDLDSVAAVSDWLSARRVRSHRGRLMEGAQVA